MTKYRFNKFPANIGLVKHTGSDGVSPQSIYEYATSFRAVYTRSMPMLKRFIDPSWPNYQESNQLYGKAQSLGVQIALSNELLIKAVLLGSIGEFSKEHNLKKLINSLDIRYIDIIKQHFVSNGLKSGHWGKVLDMSALTFIDARYGFESSDYAIDFRTHQLLNEALDDIYNYYLPDWTNLTKEQQADKELLKKEVDLVFDEEYQKDKSEKLKLWRKILN
jgi:hypothetical protein